MSHHDPRSTAVRATEQIFPAAQCRARNTSMPVDGFFSIVVPVELNHEDGQGPRRVMVKMPRSGANGEAARAQGAIERERLAYEEILPHTAISAPRAYGIAVINGDPIFVLEDLSKDRMGDQLKGLSAADAASAAVALSTVHAVRPDDVRPNESSRPSPLNLTQRIRTNTVAGFNPDGLRKGLSVVRGRWAHHVDGPAVAAFERLVSNHAQLADALWQCAPIVFTHGDARADNMAFAARGSAVETTLFDWQQIAMQPAACDLAWMLATSVEATDRELVQATALTVYNDHAETVIDRRSLTLAFALPGLAVLFLAQRETSTPRMAAIVGRSLERIGQAIVSNHPSDAI